ncbi:hypothetical protein IB223_03150 [Pseudoxanthomonas sp. PXM03]|uniref:hypothetical protein n=1 Tax=Pseudoxanthomonas sp. PXM03 TaxID=2769284 RepID=UPI00177A94CF|nr:hypothetical protein [Pseudoxanthomonas sp. PXM03]MBD9435080.1 hypothetical protein [Pseudoxanthomonas sp. PXM03]
MKLQLSLVLVATLAVSACSKPAEAPSADPQSAVSPAETPATDPSATGPAPLALDPTFSIDPPSMADCNNVVGTVRWDVRSKHPTTSDVEIMVGPEDATATLFAAGGAFGEAQTGQWTAPGAIFRLRDKASGAELARTTVAGPDCPAN